MRGCQQTNNSLGYPDRGLIANTVPHPPSVVQFAPAPPASVVPYSVPPTSTSAVRGSAPSAQFASLQKE